MLCKCKSLLISARIRVAYSLCWEAGGLVSLCWEHSCSCASMLGPKNQNTVYVGFSRSPTYRVLKETPLNRKSIRLVILCINYAKSSLGNLMPHRNYTYKIDRLKTILILLVLAYSFKQ